VAKAYRGLGVAPEGGASGLGQRGRPWETARRGTRAQFAARALARPGPWAEGQGLGFAESTRREGREGRGEGTLLAWGRYRGGWRRGRGALCVVGGRRRSSRSDSRSTLKQGHRGPNKKARRGHREEEEQWDNNQPRRRRGNVLQSVVVGRNDATAPKVDELRPTEAAVGV